MPSGQKLKIALVFDDTLDSSDGVAQYVKGLGGWLSSRGHEVTYLVGQSKTESWQGGKVYSLSKNLHVRWNGNRLSISILPRLGLIKKVLGSSQFDVVHVMVPYSPFMAKQVIKRVNQGTAVIGTIHIFPASWLSVVGSKLLKVIYGRSLKRFDQLLSVSSAAKQYGEQVFRIKSRILPNVVDVSSFSGQPAEKDNAPKVVFLGRLVKRKGCQYLIKAFAELKNQFPDAELVIAGNGPMREELEKMSRGLGVADSVKFLGYIDEKDKPALLASADIACFPSLYGECFGIVLIEAMAAGAGVVLGGDNPGYRSVLGQHEVLLVDPKNIKAFSDRLGLLLSDKELATDMHTWQNQQINQYDVNVVGDQLVSIYQQAIAKRLKSRHN